MSGSNLIGRFFYAHNAHGFLMYGYLKNVSLELLLNKDMKMILNSKVHL